MPVQGITNGYGPVIGQPETSAADISRMDFMTLLVAQIRNQDPMSPMDNAEFTSQLTQFTMLEEMESMNLKLEDNLLVGQTINNTAMLGLVGKQVTVEGNRTWVDAGEVSGNAAASRAMPSSRRGAPPGSPRKACRGHLRGGTSARV